MRRTATAKQVRENFTIAGDRLEAMRQIKDTLENQWDREKAWDMIKSIFETTEEQAKKEGTTIEGWNLFDRVTWVAKEAYILGFLQGFDTTIESNEMGYKALFGETE